MVLACAIRALPASVFGPLDFPPCSRQRRRPCIAGNWQGVPLRFRAPQREAPKNGFEWTPWGFCLLCSIMPPDAPSLCGNTRRDCADHRLSSRVNFDVFHNDLLLTVLALESLHRLELFVEEAHETCC